MKSGLPGPMRALAWGALACGCAVVALKVAAVAQEMQLPTILRPATVPAEAIDGPDPARGRRAPRDPQLLPRSSSGSAHPTRRPVRALASGGEATRRVKTEPLKRVGPPALAAPPLAPPRRRPAEADPYAPVGVEIGSFTIRPALDVDGGYDSNPNRLRDGVKGSTFVRPGAELRADSNWAAHSFQGLLRGSYTQYQDLSAANRPEAESKATWRFDVTRSTQITAETRFKLDTQSPQTTNLPFVTSGRPLTYQYGATVGAEHKINRFTIGLRGSVDRSTFDDAKLPDGTIIPQGDRNYNQYGAALRLGYELTPGIRPFVEARVDRRMHDQTADNAGYLRNSTGVGGRVGSTIELDRTLIGEASVGYETRRYEDARLSDLRGLVGDVSLIWSATPLTTIGLRGQTSLDESTTPGVSGVIVRKGTVEIAHAFLRNVTLTGSGTFQRADYRGAGLTEDTMTGTVRLDYKLSRSVAVRASYSHERLKSSLPGGDYTANVFMVGLRLQR